MLIKEGKLLSIKETNPEETKRTPPPPHPKLHKFKQCGATGKRSGFPCVQPAMKNGRCRFHGGKSTGAKTEEGKARQQQARLKSGTRSRAFTEELKKFNSMVDQCNNLAKVTVERLEE